MLKDLTIFLSHTNMNSRKVFFLDFWHKDSLRDLFHLILTFDFLEKKTKVQGQILDALLKTSATAIPTTEYL